MSENPDRFFVVDDTDSGKARTDPPVRSVASLRGEREALRRQDRRRSRVASWTGCLVLFGAALQLALVAHRALRAGHATAAVAFGAVGVASLAASVMLGRRGWSSRAGAQGRTVDRDLTPAEPGDAPAEDPLDDE